MILNPNPNKFGLEGAQESREKSIDRLCELRLTSSIPENLFREIYKAIYGEWKNEKNTE